MRFQAQGRASVINIGASKGNLFNYKKMFI